jgi:radical SAM protein with 4Fe4S-binding SPASM domain
MNLDKELMRMSPSLQGFITCRRESFGGFAYNPYLLRHVTLDNYGMDLVELLDGKRSIKDIGRKLNCDPAISETRSLKKMNHALEALNGIYGINWQGRSNGMEGSGGEMPGLHQQARTLKRKTNVTDVLSAPLSVLWDITYECNLSCPHCLSVSGKAQKDELSLEEVKAVIDQMAAQKVFTITFCGGEPLIRGDIFDIFEYVTQYDMGIKLSTNGTLITEKTMKHFEEYNVFAVQVSIDGCEETHDAFRKKRGAYKKSISALRLLAEAGYYTVVAPVLTKRNVGDLDHIIEAAIDVHAAAVTPSMFLPSGRGKTNRKNLALSSEEIRQCVSHLSDKQAELGNSLVVEMEGVYPDKYLNSESIKSCASEMQANLGCSAGNTQAVITSTGKLVPCSFLYDFVAGDLRKNTLENIWMHSEVMNVFRNIRKKDLKGKCGDCAHIPSECRGGCRAAAYLHTGDIYAEDPLCWSAVPLESGL